MSKLIILDRDGVINQDSDSYIKTVEEWQPIPGSIEAIAKLSQAGYLITVATNQSGIARGLFSEKTLLAMHEKMLSMVSEAKGKIECIVYCPHGPDDACDCRKPKTGLINQIESTLKTSAINAWLVGDSLRDIEAAEKAGCKPILVKSGKGQRTLTANPAIKAEIHDDLADFAEALLSQDHKA
ncbi:D-glycero-beta-D-manno-heptose 1,7-bisphosphate 7-phosphatase [Zooshikella marina]|uniref:D,D-heptose 1,7-bisphosphate phosphatase n=1 Tax=Zooshikella ganghwensis TaxID=202772 RepID=A0A4P9VS22_9GAMM|nr:D-glycero-beta-D-manno-heptose 1,7-bisphosphate 7-phosphatase [Zooshikella ganghwensis]MBU2705995.1 D-glycero-beta-D-manno-heptose 1,7-bisphosphate 7-phosphatase [Zooshikella ganghwensis]RDH46393.1 D-glycero-beta-D-manno-heptose 1,7-bisphosphate 7-phosphatase [Zooshikella ganghwensis]